MTRAGAGSLEPVRSLWIGDRLSKLERLSAASFVRLGHPFELFVYGDVDGVPAGVELRDANEIVPESDVFRYRSGKGRGSYAATSNLFRYGLLVERGGWWVDLDVVALRPLQFETEHVFGWETQNWVGSSILRAPAGSDLIRKCHAIAAERGAAIGWGEVGPRLLTPLIAEFGLTGCCQPPPVFYPVHKDDWASVFEPDGARPGPEARTVHLWNELIRRHDVDKNVDYSPSSLYETLISEIFGRASR